MRAALLLALRRRAAAIQRCAGRRQPPPETATAPAVVSLFLGVAAVRLLERLLLVLRH
ncbi:MAG: hypothetical protein ABTQ32_15275 [Myxococcaceae bacterium]